jgi:hypothetical protein
MTAIHSFVIRYSISISFDGPRGEGTTITRIQDYGGGLEA